MSSWSLRAPTSRYHVKMDNSLQMQSLWGSSVFGSRPMTIFSHLNLKIATRNMKQKKMRYGPPLILCCSDSVASTSSSPSLSTALISPTGATPPVVRKRKRYRRQYPGENVGISEEMRFVAMRLRNVNGKKVNPKPTAGKENAQDSENDDEEEEEGENGETEVSTESDDGDSEGERETWKPTMEGFLKYLVDSKMVFSTVERIVDESNHVAYAYFRKTGLERTEGLSRDLEWFSQQDIPIPEPSNLGVSYAKYLEELAEKSAPMFLCHFYNIYFSHIAGGQVIERQVSDKLLEGRELEIFKWEEDVQELLKAVREKLNMLGEHWSRDEKNKCLKEASKSFKFLGQIVRLIIL